MRDNNGSKIGKGDVLLNKDGYSVVVRVDPVNGIWYGQLICNPGHSCARVPYSLNDGQGYVKLFDMSATTPEEDEKAMILEGVSHGC